LRKDLTTVGKLGSFSTQLLFKDHAQTLPVPASIAAVMPVDDDEIELNLLLTSTFTRLPML